MLLKKINFLSLAVKILYLMPGLKELRVILQIKKDGNHLNVCKKEFKVKMRMFSEDLRLMF